MRDIWSIWSNKCFNIKFRKIDGSNFLLKFRIDDCCKLSIKLLHNMKWTLLLCLPDEVEWFPLFVVSGFFLWVFCVVYFSCNLIDVVCSVRHSNSYLQSNMMITEIDILSVSYISVFSVLIEITTCNPHADWHQTPCVLHVSDLVFGHHSWRMSFMTLNVLILRSSFVKKHKIMKTAKAL